ncbi:MAG: hypothetical protein INR69_00720 [Mucilaginibacter polytrichastri]|nr:hypothetical protein [Mucilaginibacter polytrichastri]
MNNLFSAKRFLAALSLLLIFAVSCKKDSNRPNPKDEEILTKKIQEIIPAQYLDTLKKYGLEIYGDVNPPDVQGSFSIKPHILLESNIPGDPKGYRFNDATIRLYDQKTEDFGISLLGRHFLKDRDTSLATAISGSGNKFTVYGRVKASQTADNYAIVAMVISGEKDGDNLKNIKTGIINVDASHAVAGFIPEGGARIAIDADSISTPISLQEFESSVVPARNLSASKHAADLLSTVH